MVIDSQLLYTSVQQMSPGLCVGESKLSFTYPKSSDDTPQPHPLNKQYIHVPVTPYTDGKAIYDLYVDASLLFVAFPPSV
jgi:hypothetical protein